MNAEFEVINYNNYQEVNLLDQVLSVDDLEDGLEITFTYENYILSCQGYKHRYAYELPSIDVSNRGCIEVLTLEKHGDYWAFRTQDFRYLGVDTKSSLFSESGVDDATLWNITFENDVTVINNVMYPDLFLQYKTISGINYFTAYNKNVKNVSIYKVKSIESIRPQYDQLYVRGSMTGWDINDDYSLNYNVYEDVYSISLYLEKYSQFKIADETWMFQFNINNTKTNIDMSLMDSDNLLAKFSGIYNIKIEGYKTSSEPICTIEYTFEDSELFYLCKSSNWEVIDTNLLEVGSTKRNLIIEVYIDDFELFTVSNPSGHAVYNESNTYYCHDITIDGEVFRCNLPNTYTLIIENYEDYNNTKLYILPKDQTYTVTEALALPDDATCKVYGEIIYENNKPYLTDGTDKILLYNINSHYHQYEKGYISGTITTYNGEKEITNSTFETNSKVNYNYIKLYNEITNVEQLYDGLTIILTADNYIMTCQNTKYRNVELVEDINSLLYGCFELITLESVNGNWLLKTKSNEYLYCKNDGNYIYTGNVDDDSKLWNISCVDGQIVIANVLYPERGIQFNSSKFNRVATYKFNQSNPRIYEAKIVNSDGTEKIPFVSTTYLPTNDEQFTIDLSDINGLRIEATTGKYNDLTIDATNGKFAD